MKSFIQAVAVATLVVLPVVSFAQSSAPLTRAEVKAQLVQIEKAGFNPSTNSPNYPADIQAAEARLQKSYNSAGGVAAESSQAGVPTNLESVYSHH